MNRWLIFSILLVVSPVTSLAWAGQYEDYVALPEIPRVSAFEAYLKYKEGKAIIIQAGGITYKLRHILGAYDIDAEAVVAGNIELPALPTTGVEIFTYCY